MRNGFCLHDEHGKAASPLSQAISGVNQGREAVAMAVLLHIELYVPTAANIPALAREKEQQQNPQRREADVLPVGRSQSCRGGEDAGDADRRFDDGKDAAFAGEDSCADQVDRILSGHAWAAQRKREERTDGQQQVRKNQPAKAQAPEDQLCGGEHAQIHGPIRDQLRKRGKQQRHRPTHLPMIAIIIETFGRILKKELSLKSTQYTTLTSRDRERNAP